ncbi:MAG: nitroreductase [Oligosphaeraceae bacterium]|nr:nitroreductase [Oligosphaeraceae bacterium]
MNFLNLAAQRYSVRKFRPEPVSESDLQVILEAGRLAPTACNLQPQRIYVIRSAAGLEKLRRCTSCHFEAPLVLLICYDSSASWKRSFDGFESGCMDASIVGTHIMLAAAERGLGSTWVCYFDPALLRREFSLPKPQIPALLLPLGYPAPDAVPNPMHFQRQNLADTVFYD